jgi:hypothetical protein
VWKLRCSLACAMYRAMRPSLQNSRNQEGDIEAQRRMAARGRAKKALSLIACPATRELTCPGAGEGNHFVRR